MTLRCPAKVSENIYLLTEMQSAFENYIEQSDKTLNKNFKFWCGQQKKFNSLISS